MKVVLVVADDKGLCEALRAALPESYLLLFSPTIDDALRQLITLKADLIIVDDSPLLGRQAVGRIREASPGMPVFALSTHEDPETLAGFTLAGATAALAKPFSCDDLRERLAAITEGREPRSPAPAPAPPAASPTPGSLTPYQTALRWIGRIAGHICDPERLGESLVHALTDICDAARCVVLFEDPSGIRILASQGIPSTVAGSVRLGFDSGIMHWFELNARLIDRNGDCPPDVAKEMQLLGARLGVPLIKGGRVCGALLVGDPASGRTLTQDERELLAVVARATSIALENAHRYAELTEQRRRLDTVLSNISAGVIVVRPDKTVSMMNGSAEHILQVRAADMIGRSVQKLGSGFADVALRTLADGKPRMRQEVADPAINATLGMSASPLSDGGVAVIFSRLPEERAAPRDIAYSPFWEYLASRVSQEIKNPLVAINTFAQLLPRKYESEDFRTTFGEVVQKEVKRINAVVETLFEFARHPRLALRRSNVNEAVTEVLRGFEERFGEHRITLETALDPSQPEADLDPDYFSQAVRNVVQNAIEAMPAGGKLRVSTARDDRGCEIVVADTGPGVPEQDAPLVFMPFFSTKARGMGLGLTLADRIMKQHRGELRLASNEEGGGAFAFRLPPAGDVNANRPGH